MLKTKLNTNIKRQQPVKVSLLHMEIRNTLEDNLIAATTAVLKAAKQNATARAGVGSGKRPVVNAIGAHAVHREYKIGKCRHEALDNFANCAPSRRRCAAVDRQRALRRKERCHSIRVLAAPRRGITFCKIAQHLSKA